MTFSKGKGKGIEFLRQHVAEDDGPCLIWPFARDNHGYGMGGHEGTYFKAHKKMCEMVHGPRPSPQHQASHSCNNGHGGCVHPKHVSWETSRDNHLRRKANGTARTNRYGQNGGMTFEQAVQILHMRHRNTQEQIASRFKISKPTVRNVFKGKTRVARAALSYVTE